MALKAIKQGIPLRVASDTYGIPKSTLHDLKNNSGENKKFKPGPDTYFSYEEEENFKNFILECADRGFPLEKEEFLDKIQDYVIKLKKDNPFTNNRPGQRWWEEFLRRWPDLSLRTAQN